MSEMIERVALAMAELLKPYQGNASVGDLEGTEFTYVDVGPLDMAELARAAIEAMREPTEAMSRQGDRTINPYGADMHPGHNHAWRAMIDEALKE